jgi:hypothetical protein
MNNLLERLGGFAARRHEDRDRDGDRVREPAPADREVSRTGPALPMRGAAGPAAGMVYPGPRQEGERHEFQQHEAHRVRNAPPRAVGIGDVWPGGVVP